MKAPYVLLTLILALGCGPSEIAEPESEIAEPEQVTQCRAIKAAGMVCAEYLSLEEALARHKSEGARAKLKERYARDEKLCKVRVRRGYNSKQAGELAGCMALVAQYEREQRQKK